MMIRLEFTPKEEDDTQPLGSQLLVLGAQARAPHPGGIRRMAESAERGQSNS